MREYLLISYPIYHLESKILFRFKNINSYIFENKNAREFHRKRYSTFTNTNIEKKKSKKILKKLESHEKLVTRKIYLLNLIEIILGVN